MMKEIDLTGVQQSVSQSVSLVELLGFPLLHDYETVRWSLQLVARSHNKHALQQRRN